MSDDLIRLPEAARRLGVSVITVKRYFKRGHLIGLKLPTGHLRIAVSSLPRCAVMHDKRLRV